MPKPPKPHRPPKHERPEHRPPKPEDQKMVKLLVGEHENPTAKKAGPFMAEWVEFEGKRVATYERDHVMYSAYRCTAYDYDAYRVYISDETNPLLPQYALKPYLRSMQGAELRDYSEPFDLEELISVYPMFATELGDFRTRLVDPKPRF